LQSLLVNLAVSLVDPKEVRCWERRPNFHSFTVYLLIIYLQSSPLVIVSTSFRLKSP
jgi:hypothetical protein